jgi:hypothetical protein
MIEPPSIQIRIDQACRPSQSMTATITSKIPPRTKRTDFLELPLRGESLAAWLNSLFIPS